MTLTQVNPATILASDMIGVTELANELGLTRAAIHKRLKIAKIVPVMKPFGPRTKAFLTVAQAKIVRKTATDRGEWDPHTGKWKKGNGKR